MLPRSRGGKDEWGNLVLSDKAVNAHKGNRLPHEAGLKRLKVPRTPKELPVTALIRNAHVAAGIGTRLAPVGLAKHQVLRDLAVDREGLETIDMGDPNFRRSAVTEPGETIVMHGGVYRETLRPRSDGVAIRAMKGEKVTISGADRIEDGKRKNDDGWSRPLPSEPTKVLRDGQPWSEFTYDQAAKRIVVRGGDPRLHLFETVAQELGIDLGGKKDLKIESIALTNTPKWTK